jgi:cytochrome c553
MPRRGHELAYTCQGCHSIPNYKNVYPTYSVPKLSGQRPEYLVAALKAYKSGERSHGTMHSQASSMSEQDMADIAAYLAGANVLTKSANDVPGRRRVPRPARPAWRATAPTASASRPTIRPSPASTRTTSSARCTITRRAAARIPSWAAWRRR